MTLAEYLTIAADNCVHNGDVDIAVLMRQAASLITRQEAQLAESEQARERMREALKSFDNTAKGSVTIIGFAGKAVKLLPKARAALAADQEKNDE